MRSRSPSRATSRVKNWPPISAALLPLAGRVPQTDGEWAAPCGEIFSILGELAACVARSFAERWQFTFPGPPNDACLRRFYKPFSANLRVKKGFDFVQDGRAGPSVAHLAACGLKVQVS